MKNFEYLGRIKNKISEIKDSVLQSKQMGRRENKAINIDGRVQAKIRGTILIYIHLILLSVHVQNSLSEKAKQLGNIQVIEVQVLPLNSSSKAYL